MATGFAANFRAVFAGTRDFLPARLNQRQIPRYWFDLGCFDSGAILRRSDYLSDCDGGRD